MVTEDSTKMYKLLAEVDDNIKRKQRQLEELYRLKGMLVHLPKEVLEMSGRAMMLSDSLAHLIFDECEEDRGDLAYAKLFDADFNFPPKPTFNEYSQTFSRRGDLKVQTPLGEEIKFTAIVGSVAKPPSCRIEEVKSVEEVTRYKAVCDDDGEEL